MLHILENEYLRISLGEDGGELFSITGKKNDTEFLWNGRKYGWSLSALTMFPIIGKVKNGVYRVDNKEYKMNQHGFASRLKHEVINKDNNSIEFQLSYSKKTLKHYPFKFVLKSKYVVEKNVIKIKFTVDNIDNKDIIFTLGSHPAFKCPLKEGESVEDYYLEFNEIEDSAKILTITKDDFLTGKEKEIFNNDNKLFLTENTFKNGTIIFNNLKSNMVTLKSINRKESVTINFRNFKYLSLWALEETKPFICIEPWLGHADYNDFIGEFKEKEGNIILPSDDSFSCEYEIIINE